MRIMKGYRLHTGMLVLAMLGLILSLPLAAYAAEYTRLGSLVSVADEPHQHLNTVKASVDAGELNPGDVVLIRLPKDFVFNGGDWSYGTVGSDVYYGDYDEGCYIYVPWDHDNSLNMDTSGGWPVPKDIFTIDRLGDNEIRVQVNSIYDPSVTEDGQFFIYLKDVDVPGGFKGAIALSFDAPGGSGFGSGEVSGGRVGKLNTGDGKTDGTDNEGENGDRTGTGDEGNEQGDARALTAVFTLGSETFKLNDTYWAMDAAPYARNGRMYLPVRYVARIFGSKVSSVTWNKGTAEFVLDGKVVSMTIGSRKMYVDGTAVAIDAAPEIVKGRTMVPARWIAVAFGADVSWDAAARAVTVNINSENK